MIKSLFSSGWRYFALMKVILDPRDQIFCLRHLRQKFEKLIRKFSVQGTDIFVYVNKVELFSRFSKGNLLFLLYLKR